MRHWLGLPLSAAVAALLPTTAATELLDPTIFYSYYANTNLGEWRAAPQRDQVWISAGVLPSPDSDLIPISAVPLSDNGNLTTVTASHPTLTSPVDLFHVGPTTPFGGGWGQYFRSYSRDDWDTSDPALQQPWTITAANPAGPTITEATVTTNVTTDAQRLPQVTDTALTGNPVNPLQPILSWTPPSNVSYTDQNIVIWELELDENGMLADTNFKHSESAGSSQTGAFIFPEEFNGIGIEGGNTPQLGTPYLVAIELRELDPDTGQLRGLSRKFIEFIADGSTPETKIFLPTVTEDPDTSTPVYNFDVAVEAGQRINIDPFVAVGYDYAIGEGDPGFRSVILPEVGDNRFELWLFDEFGDPFDSLIELVSGEEFNFVERLNLDPLIGLDQFRILGIETAAMLDPNNVQAFVTGLTFVADGRFTGTQTPIAVFVEVSEPGTLALLLAGLLALRQAGRLRLASDSSTQPA